jgi:hypothetical protein
MPIFLPLPFTRQATFHVGNLPFSEIEAPGVPHAAHGTGRVMSTVIIAALTMLAGFLGMRLIAAVSENTALRTQVTSLKRQLRGR